MMLWLATMAATLAVAPQDTTIPVERGMRLDLRITAGKIRVRTWQRDAVEVSFRGRAGVGVDADRSGSVLRIRTTDDVFTGRRRGRRYTDDERVDAEVMVPAYLHLELTGVETDISVVGAGGDVTAATVEGGIELRGGNGFISLEAVEEDVRVEGARGRLRVNTSEGAIRLRDVQGDVDAESIDGDIDLIDVDGSSISASTVDGSVSFAGPIHDDGRYRLATHDGDVMATVPADANATVTVATYDGDFESSFPIVLRGATGRRVTFSLGTGRAVLELEAFDGDVFLRRRP